MELSSRPGLGTAVELHLSLSPARALDLANVTSLLMKVSTAVKAAHPVLSGILQGVHSVVMSEDLKNSQSVKI